MRLLIVFTAICLALGCQRYDPSSAVESPHLFARTLRRAAVGCYRLDPYGVTDLQEKQELMRYFATFRLSEGPSALGNPAMRDVTGMHQPTADPVTGVVVAWMADSLSDSITVDAGDGFSGFGVHVAPDLHGWSGHAYTWGDVGPPFEHELGPARIIPMGCAESAGETSTGPARNE